MIFAWHKTLACYIMTNLIASEFGYDFIVSWSFLNRITIYTRLLVDTVLTRNKAGMMLTSTAGCEAGKRL